MNVDFSLADFNCFLAGLRDGYGQRAEQRAERLAQRRADRIASRAAIARAFRFPENGAQDVPNS